MANFNEEIMPLLEAEGGLNTNKADRGGITKYGISKKAYPALDIEKLTPSQAASIYKSDYWDKIGGDDLPQPLAAVMFDTAVNHGVGKAKKILANSGGDIEGILKRREFLYGKLKNQPGQGQFYGGWMSRIAKLRDRVGSMLNPIGTAYADETPWQPSDDAALDEGFKKFLGSSANAAHGQFDAASNRLVSSQQNDDAELDEGFKAFLEKNKYDPTEGMSTTEKVLAGIGGAMTDLGQGIGQTVGLVSPEDVAEKRRLDKPLMDTTAGKVGNVAGNVAMTLPAAFIPGVNTLKGAALAGAGIGALQPATSQSEVLGNTALGAGANALGVMLPRAAEAVYKGGKALLIEPFTKKGMDEIAGRTLARFSENPKMLGEVVDAKSVTGAAPTLAEITKDKGIASLQDALRATDPQIENIIAQRLQDNNAARAYSLKSLAGDAIDREKALSTRELAAKPFYEQAFANKVEITDKFKELLSRPSVKKALPRASLLAKEEGRNFGLKDTVKPTKFLVDPKGNKLSAIDGYSGEITGQTLHDIKMGMDALLKDPNSGIVGAEIKAIKNTRAELIKEIESVIPGYKAARLAYAEKSAPINAMEIGDYISKKALSNTSDLGGNQKLQANALLGLLKDPKRLIELGTGRKGGGSDLSKIFNKDQMVLLKKIAQEADIASAVASAGNGPGSATAKRMAAQNILRQMLGPLGMPEKWIESALAQTIAKPLNIAYGGVVEPKLQKILANAVLNPETATRVLNAANKSATKGVKPTDNALRKLLATVPAVSASANSSE